uniref:BTB domain-containing protein n=1 Tax=Panagrolaimus sp. PS1159 TaxID=55785 RepID=A0AC35FCC9_9BILA
MQQYPQIKTEIRDSFSEFSELSSGIGTSESASQAFGAHLTRTNKRVKHVAAAAASSLRSRSVSFKIPSKTSAKSRSRTIQRVKSVAAASSLRSRSVSFKIPTTTSAKSRSRTVQRVKSVAADSTPQSSQPFGADLTNSRTRSRTLNYRFSDGTVHQGAIFTRNKKCPQTNANNDEVQRNRGQKRTHDFEGDRTAASREHGTIPVLVDMQKQFAMSQRSRTVNPAHCAAVNSSQRSRTIKMIVPKSSILLRGTGSTPQSTTIQRVKPVAAAASSQRSRSVSFKFPLTTVIESRPRTIQRVKPVAADSTSRSRSVSFKIPTTTSATSRSRTVGPAAAPRQRQRTRGRPKKDEDEIEYDCEIEGVEKFFKVCRRLLSEKSIGFRTLFDANKEDKIELEGIPDRTLELAFSFCHGKPLKDLTNDDLFSLNFFADCWEIPELKKALEEQQMITKLKPYNGVIHAYAAQLSNTEAVKTACENMMLEQMTNGGAV